ncbi:DUF6153 family protein [Streptomyces sp. ADMS]|uniref:DUF6153 family protein n=1 Tax=Streptomyces sp. ADMS TaxID=3071415 RepID=UPI00399405C1
MRLGGDPRPRRDPGPGRLGTSGIATAAHPLTPVPYELAGGRAPPSLAELQLLRI